MKSRQAFTLWLIVITVLAIGALMYGRAEVLRGFGIRTVEPAELSSPGEEATNR